VDLPYKDIKEIENKNTDTITLYVNNEKRFSFSTLRIPAFLVKKSIEYFRSQAEHLPSNQVVTPIRKDVLNE
jgi:hypothetical protein